MRSEFQENTCPASFALAFRYLVDREICVSPDKSGRALSVPWLLAGDGYEPSSLRRSCPSVTR
jgi:hypothetical protein